MSGALQPMMKVAGRLLPTEFRNVLRGPMAIAGSGSLVLKIAAMGIGFLQAVLAARLLGVRDYGVFAFVTSVVSITATLAVLGMAPLAVRELARLKAIAAWEQAAEFFRTSRIIVLGTSALAGAGVSAFALLVPGLEYRSELALAGLLIPPTSMLLLIQGHGRGLGAIVRGQMPVVLIRPAVTVAIFAILYFTAEHLVAFDAVLVVLFSSFAALVFAGLVLRQVWPKNHLKRDAALGIRKHLRHAASFFAMSIAMILQANFITLLLVWLSGPEQAGLFQPIALLAPLMVIGLDTITMPIAPRIAHLWELGDVARLRKTLRMAMLVAISITVCVTVGILVLAPVILRAFGKEFVALQPVLLWIAFAQFINAASGHVDSLLAMTSHQGDVVKCQIAQLLVNLVLGVILIPGSGAQGASIALAGGIVTYNVCALIYARKRLGFDPALPGVILAFYSNQQRGSA